MKQHENYAKFTVPPRFQISLKMLNQKEKKEKVNRNLWKERDIERTVNREKVYHPEKYQKVLINQLFAKKEEIISQDFLKHLRTVEVLIIIIFLYIF